MLVLFFRLAGWLLSCADFEVRRHDYDFKAVVGDLGRTWMGRCPLT